MRHRTRHRVLIGLIMFLAIALATPRTGEAAATITVINRDGPGEGFNDSGPPDPDSTAGGNTGATLGEQRLVAFRRAAEIWGRFVDSSVEIRVGANFDDLFCSATSTVLGGAGPVTVDEGFTGAPRADTWYPQALANAIFGLDLAPGTDDIEAFFNSAVGTHCSFPKAWYYGLDDNPPGDKIDFVSIVLHELAHGLGFLTLVDVSSGAKFMGLDDVFMLNLLDWTKVYSELTDAERAVAWNLVWSGPAVTAAGRGLEYVGSSNGYVSMYSPMPAEPGSSASHFEDWLFPDQMMEPFYTDTNHGPGLAHDLMTDIGWSTATRNIDADLSGDRASDIVWRNTRTGSVYAWLMNGFQKGVGPLDSLSLQWEIKGLGDFDGLGAFDILWRNKTNRRTVIWQMNAFRRLTITSIGQPSADWEIVGVGDFDGDSTTDILWRNKVTGSTLIWRIGWKHDSLGYGRPGKVSQSPIGRPSLAWEVAGVGDFDGDNADDILWRNTKTGSTVIWRIVNFARNSRSAVGAPSLAWEIVGVGDFDGDETDDILWRNKNTDSTVIWRMVNLARNGAKSIGRPSESWQVACVGDYDGAAADILWRNANDGKTAIWQMDGFDRKDVRSIGAPSDDWQIRC